MTKQLLANKRKALLALPLKRLSGMTQHLALEVKDDTREQSHVDALLHASGDGFGKALSLLTRDELLELCAVLGVECRARSKKDVLLAAATGAMMGGVSTPAVVARAESASGQASGQASGHDKTTDGKAKKKNVKKPVTGQRPSSSREHQKQQSDARDLERAIREPGWAHIDARTLAGLDSPDFARLCHEFLSIERNDRHAASTLLERTSESGVAGTDLRCTVVERPVVSAEYYARLWAVAPLIDDTPGITLFRCKAGSTWRADVKRDAKMANDEARSVLQAGGRLVIFCNESRKRLREKSPIERELANVYARALKDRSPDVADLEERINVVPADELSLFVRSRRPVELSLESRDQLGVPRIPQLIEFESWANAHMPEHRALGLAPSAFQWDRARIQVREQLLRMLAMPSEDPYSHVAWLDGPSGVGKTRLLIEILRGDPSLRGRTLVAPSTDSAVAALSAHRLFEQYPTALLIIEEGTTEGLAQLVPWLDRYNHKGIGGLIALTAMTDSGSAATDARIPAVFQRCRMDVRVLDDGAYRALIAREAGTTEDSAEVARLAELTEGAPWLAALVAREFAAGAAMPTNATEAVELAICGHADPEREQVLDLRVRVLLLMMLIGDVDWNNLTSDDRESLCRAVGVANFDSVEQGRRACMERGLLHVQLGPRPERVTPSIVAREVAKKMLQPTVEGPAPQATPLGEHARRLLPALYSRLEPLGLDRLVAVQLAAPIARALEFDAPGVAVVGPSAVGREELVFATRYQLPQRLARVLGRRIEETSLEELRERVDIRSALVEAMEELSARKWSFERAENALFRLALAENQVLTNNATNTWANLFTIEGSQTYRAFLVRLSLCQRRCTEGEVAERVLGLESLRAAVDVERRALPVDPLDGPYPEISRAEVYTSRLAAWKLLIQFMTDNEPAVADRAGEIAVESLPFAVTANMGGEIAARLAEAAPLLAEPIQRALGQAVRELQRAREAASKHMSSHWDKLLEVLMPRNFMRSLRERVGAWSTSEVSEETDRELARHGLSDPGRPVLAQLEWLVSEDAVRRTSFATALGLEDHGRIALDPLVNLARKGQGADVLAAYLAGWQQANRTSEVAQVLRALRMDFELSDAVALTIWHLGASDENIGMLLELVERSRGRGRGVLAESTLRLFATSHWLKGVEPKPLARLVDALIDQNEAFTNDLACALLLLRLGPALKAKKQWRTRLERALRGATRPDAPLSTYWRHSALLLIDADVDIAQLVLDAAVSADQPQDRHTAWSVFDACAEKNPKNTWNTLVARCQEADASTARYMAREVRHHGVASRFQPKLVMSWVDDDQARGTWAARLIRMHDSDELPTIAYKLLQQFGPGSECAARLESNAAQPPRNTTDVADFHGVQIARARRWSQDSSPEVCDWANSLIARLERHLQAHRA